MNSQINDAKNGARIFLASLGLNLSQLDSFPDVVSKVNYAKSTVNYKYQNLVEAIIEERYLPNNSFSFSPFYKTNPRTAGDSAEWYCYFIELNEGKTVQKEVHFDLTEHIGETATVLGNKDIIINSFRSSDVVVKNNSGEIHQEIKVGVWGTNLRKRIRAEIYADIIRLTERQNDEQEYRIYANALNNKSLLDDKEQVKYLLTIASLFPRRVRLYFNDEELSISDFGLKAGLSISLINKILQIGTAGNDVKSNLTVKVQKGTFKTGSSKSSRNFFSGLIKIIGKIFRCLKTFVIWLVKLIGNHLKAFVIFLIVLFVVIGGICLIKGCSNTTKKRSEGFYDGDYFGVTTDLSAYYDLFVYGDNVWNIVLYEREPGKKLCSESRYYHYDVVKNHDTFSIKYNHQDTYHTIFEGRESSSGEFYFVITLLYFHPTEIYLYKYSEFTRAEFYSYKDFELIKDSIIPGEQNR